MVRQRIHKRRLVASFISILLTTTLTSTSTASTTPTTPTAPTTSTSCSTGDDNCPSSSSKDQQPIEDTTAATFTLFDNGASTGGVEVTLSFSDFERIVSDEMIRQGDNDDEPKKDTNTTDGETKKRMETASIAFASKMSYEIRVSKFAAEEPVIANRAFREDGELVTSFEQLLPREPEPADDGEGGEGGLIGRRVYLVAEDLEFVWPFISLYHRQAVSPNVLRSPIPGDDSRVVVESISETPRVFRILNMFTIDEANQLIQTSLDKTGEDAIKRSTTGESLTRNEDPGRTSSNNWDHTSPGAVAMIERSFRLTNIEQDDAKRDGLQVVRYTEGQGYNTHPDFFTPSDGKDFDFHPYSGGSNRFATVFMYLNDVEEGGYTVFPRADGIVPERSPPQEGMDLFREGSWEKTVLQQCYSKLAVPAVAGTAALFYSITPDGQIDPSSHHAACPLTSGIKWGANIWIWNQQRYGDIRTGDERRFTIKNLCPETIYVSWESKPNGEVRPGHVMPMNSFEFHRFQAYFGGHGKGRTISYYTCRDDNAVWEVKPPRDYNERKEQEIAREQMKEKRQQQQQHLHIKNNLEEIVMLYFEGNSLGVVNGGERITMNTFDGHIFEAMVWKDNSEKEVTSIDKFFVNGDIEQNWNIVATDRYKKIREEPSLSSTITGDEL